MSFKVALILDNKTDFTQMKRRLDEIGVEFWHKDCKAEDDIISAGQPADFIITVLGKYHFTHRVLGALKKCRFIETLGVGYDAVDVAVATNNGIGIINNPDYPIEELSDHTMALILACSRRIVQLNDIVKRKSTTSLEKEWVKMMRLKGKTLGLVGFGRIAKAVCSKAQAFGMNIIVFDPYLHREEIEKYNAKPLGLGQLLEIADFVSIHAVLTPETKRLIGLEQLRSMKSTAFIINTARGAIVDQEALYVALSDGFIAGAALDVTDPELIAPDSPLLSLDNVILTGHSGHSSPESWAHRLNRPPDEINRVLRSQWPIGLVNPQVKQLYVQKWGPMTNSD